MRLHAQALLLAGCTAMIPEAAVAQSAQPVPGDAPPLQTAQGETLASPADGQPETSGEIVVTARKRSERLIEIPATINPAHRH